MFDIELMNTMKIINAYNILKNNRDGYDEDKNLSVNVLGPLLRINLANCQTSEIESQNESGLEVPIIENNFFVSVRARRFKEVFTSELYTRQKKRNNSVVTWNKGTKYGIIKYFIQKNDVIYCAVSVLIAERSRTEAPIHRQFKMYLSDIAVPVRKSYCLKFINIEEVQKTILIDNKICILPNDYEPKK